MTIAFDSSLEQLGLGASPDPFTFNFSPVGTLRGIALAVIIEGNVDAITSVTYGGASLTRVVFVADTAGEPARVEWWFLGSSIPTGTQQFSIDHSAAATLKNFVVVGVTGADDTEIGDFDSIGGDQADPQLTLTTAGSMCFCVIGSGLPAPTSLTILSGMTAVQDHDLGQDCYRCDRQTDPNTGTFTIGYTAASDDVAMAAIAIKEVGAAAPTSAVYPSGQRQMANLLAR